MTTNKIKFLAILTINVICLFNTSISLGESQHEQAVDKLKNAIIQKYSYRDLNGVNWDKMFHVYSPVLNRAKTPEDFAKITVKMLEVASDPHIWVKVNGKGVPGGFRRKVVTNYNMQFLSRRIPQWESLNNVVSMGRFDKDIGYILINSWSRSEKEPHKAAFEALKKLSDIKVLIIDVRPNSGGSEPLAQNFAGCFIDKPVVYAKHVYPDRSKKNDGWKKVQKRILKPNPDVPQYMGKVVVLTGQENMSSCEAFLLMMKQVKGCVLIGDKSYGSSGNPKPYDLGNGVTVYLPSWKALRPDETCFEGQGIKPDYLVRSTKDNSSRTDPVLSKAFLYII